MFKRHKSTSSRLTQIAQKRSGQPGQVAVVVLLIMAALLIIVLNYASRTTDQVFLSGQQQDSTRVFNAAESEVEKTLSEFEGSTAPLGGTFNYDGGIEATSNVQPQTGELTIANLPEGMTATVNVDGEEDAQVDWAGEGTCDNRAALILTLYYEDSGGTLRSKYQPVRPKCDATKDIKGVGFVDSAASTTAGYEDRYMWDFFPSETGVTAKLLRITALYESTKLRVTGISAIQAHDVTVRASDTADATGTSGTASEERAIQVTRTVPAPPMVLDYAVYSGGSLEKN